MVKTTETQKWFQDNLNFDRNVLRHFNKYKELDVKKVHPRELLRKVRNGIEKFKDSEGNFIFTIESDPIKIESENVGQGLGFIKGGLRASHDEYIHKKAKLTYDPFEKVRKELIIGFVVFSILAYVFAQFYFMFTVILFVLSCLSIYFYYILRNVKTETKFSLVNRDEICFLMEGEMKEGKVSFSCKISSILAGHNYYDFLEENRYSDYFNKNFELERATLSKDIPNLVFSIAKILSNKHQTELILNAIEQIKKEIFKEIYDSYRKLIGKKSEEGKSIVDEELGKMDSGKIKKEITKFGWNIPELNEDIFVEKLSLFIEKDNEKFPDISKKGKELEKVFDSILKQVRMK